MKKEICLIIVVAIVSCGLLGAGCVTPAPQPIVYVVNNNTTSNVTTAPTVVQQTQVQVSQTQQQTQIQPQQPTQQQVQIQVQQPALIATTINVWTPPVWYGWGLVNQQVTRGNPATVAVYVTAADGTTPCGPFSYYIDHQAAGGVWSNPSQHNGCGVGLLMHAELQLSRSDTAKLIPGVHTFQISYAGDNVYAPAEYITEFTVVAK